MKISPRVWGILGDVVWIIHLSDSDENAIDCEISCDCVKRANVVVDLPNWLGGGGGLKQHIEVRFEWMCVCVCVCVGVCFSMFRIRGSSPLPVFLVFAPELIHVSIAYTPEGLLDGGIVFTRNLTDTVMITLYTASTCGSWFQEKKINAFKVSPESGSFDLSKMTTEPLTFDYFYRLCIEETAGEGRILFDKPFTLDGKLGFGKLWKSVQYPF